MNTRYFNGPTRAVDGAIVTFVNLEDGSSRVEHRAGFSYETGSGPKRITHKMTFLNVLRALLDEADGWEGDWKVRCISTPESVLMDIKGRQVGHDQEVPNAYEAALLTQAGRPDMWERDYSDHAAKRHRELGNAAA